MRVKKCTRRQKRYVKLPTDGECSSSSTCSSCSWLTKDTENLKEQFIMAITLTPKPEASTSNYPKNIGIVITGLGNIAAALLCPPWLDLRAESRLSPLYTFEHRCGNCSVEEGGWKGQPLTDATGPACIEQGMQLFGGLKMPYQYS
ncbi:hypothetical protein F2P79_004418 [Pimephales promelas]|nr:hypothetical protein F2P79_004418 [Pimephales promelas]